MARAPQVDDFQVKVPDVGSFVFASRTMRDEFAIQVEYARLIDGAPPTEWLQVVGGWYSALRVLTVRAPDDWDLEKMDPKNPKTYAKLAQVYNALIEKEGDFRR